MKEDKIVEVDNYLVDAETGKKVVFYECDFDKNTECHRDMCRGDGKGFCTKTTNPKFAKADGRSWYAVKKYPEVGEPYWGREYLDEEE